jgi:hypothetical protein
MGALMTVLVNDHGKVRFANQNEMDRMYALIRLDLMLADKSFRAADDYGIKGLLSREQVTNYHWVVFQSHGLDTTAFGGTWSSVSALNYVTRFMWGGNFDRSGR